VPAGVRDVPGGIAGLFVSLPKCPFSVGGPGSCALARGDIGEMEPIVNLLCAGGVLISSRGCRGRVFLSVQGTQKHGKSCLSVGLFLHALLAGGLPGALAGAGRSPCPSPSQSRERAGAERPFGAPRAGRGTGARGSSVLCAPQVSAEGWFGGRWRGAACLLLPGCGVKPCPAAGASLGLVLRALEVSWRAGGVGQ